MRWLAALGALPLLACSAGARFSPTGPVELFANVDDDDRNGIRDGLDQRLDDLDDAAQISATINCFRESAVELSIEPPSAAEHLRVFRQVGQWQPLLGAGLGSTTQAACGSVELAVEALRTRSSIWDGSATLTLRAEGALLASLSFRVLPVVFPDVTRPAVRIYAVQIDHDSARKNRTFIDELDRSKGAAALELAQGAGYRFERWMQDAISSGSQVSPNGRVQEVLLAMDRATGASGLEGFAATRLAPNRGLALPGRDEPNLLSAGGNLEVIPPHPGFPSGRLVIGGGGDRRMGRSTRAWLEAQEVQGPLLEVSTQWLETGHLDEIVTFVPASSPRGWVVVLASPRLANDRLRALVTEGFGSRQLRFGQATRTVDSLTQDKDLAEANEEAQVKMDAVRAQLSAALGLAESELVDFPQLFVRRPEGFASAHPSLVNMVILDRVALMLSTDVDGDIFEATARDRLKQAGVDPRFVEDAGAYFELGGGLHCGVEVHRAPRAHR